MRDNKRLLVIRLSALGDVAILEPILRVRASANPDVTFYLAAPPLLEPLFKDLDNVVFVPTLKKQSPQLLYEQLSKIEPTMVADMHHINRTIGLSWLFRLHGVPVRSIRKRTLKRKPSWLRYDEVFDRCGLKKDPARDAKTIARQYWQPRLHEGVKKIGIAPFAQHIGKIWPQDQTEALLRILSDSGKYKIQLFGSKSEAEILDLWAKLYPNVESLAGKYTFEEELSKIFSLDLMVSMDSSNMHFASCLGVPVVSIWGATDPCRGFYGWRQNPDWAIYADMKCRPCSKYGDKPCKLKGYPCMKAVTPEMVAAKIASVIG